MDYKKHLVDCPHCGEQILDHMTQCPKCGGKIKGYTPMDDEKAAAIKRKAALIAFAVFAIVLAYILISRFA